MVNMLDEQLANAICTAVTIGFLKEIGSKTTYIYEKDTIEEKNANTTLISNLQNIDKDLNINISLQKQGNFYVIAKTTYVNDDTQLLINDINNYIGEIVQAATHNKFYGAYIGGIVKPDNSIELSGTSSLKLYPKPTKQTSGWNISLPDKKIKEAFYSAQQVITLTDKYLVDAINKYKNVPNKTHLTYIEDYHLNSPCQIETNQFFGSIHGLVRVIIAYDLTASGILSSKYSTCCEYAYTEETNKVASCIPCSIFAASNGTPANYTHFGRGDYWNFPDIDNHKIKIDNLNKRRKKWEQYVGKCFQTGYNLLNKVYDISKVNLNQLFQFSDEQIGEIFLHSLMFEGKFIDKINSTINVLSTQKK